MPKEEKPQFANVAEWGPPGRRHIIFKGDPEYWQALGQFVEAFASVEIVLFTLTVYYARMPILTARIILSGARTDVCVGHIRKIIEIERFKDDVKRELDDVLRHLAEINNVRNHILHYGSFETSDKGRVVSNISRVTPDKVQEMRVSPDILRAMTSDLYKIGNHLVMLRIKRLASFEERANDAPILRDAWQYKFASPNQKDRNRRKRGHRRDRKGPNSQP